MKSAVKSDVKSNKFLSTIFGISVALSLATTTATAESTSGSPQLGSNSAVNSITDSKNQIVKLTDHGLEPAEIHMKKDDVILFFLNDSTDALATLEIEYGERTMHCSGGNLRAEGTKIHSVRPFGPKDFASVCFHDPGTYGLKVLGLKKNPAGIETKIFVE